MDTISGVCGQCIGRNRRIVRQKRKAGKLIAIAVICVIGFFALQYLASQGVLQKVANDVSEKVSETTKGMEKQGSDIAKSFEQETNKVSESIKPKPENPNIRPSKPKEPESNPISDKPEIVVSELELQIHNLINNERESRGLQPLAFDTKLTSIARQHSEDMSLRNFFVHENPEGQDPTSRGLQVGYTCHKELGGGYYSEGIAENIFQNNLYDSYTQYGIYTSYDWNTPEELAKSTVDGWMHSSGHKQNILTTTYDRQGIGVAVSMDDKVYITEDFC